MKKIIILTSVILAPVLLGMHGLSDHELHGKLLIDRSYFSPDKQITDCFGKKRALGEQDYQEAVTRFNGLPVELKKLIVSYAIEDDIKKLPVGFVLYHTLAYHIHSVDLVAWHPSNPGILASGGNDGTALRLHLETSTACSLLEGPRGSLNAVAWHLRDPDIIAFGNNDGAVRILNTKTGASQVFEGHAGNVRGGNHPGQVNSVAWNPSDPDVLASAGDDGTVRILNTKTGASQVFEGHRGWVRSVAWNPSDPDVLASGGSDGTARVLNTKTGASQVFEGHVGWTHPVAWNPSDPDVLASGDGNGTVHILNTKTGASQVFEMFGGHRGQRVNSVAWHLSDPDIIASGGDDGTVCILNTKTRAFQVLDNHGGSYVNSVAWNPSNTDVLASGGGDGTVRVLADNRTPLEYLTSSKPTYEQMVMVLWLLKNHIPKHALVVEGAIKECNKILGTPEAPTVTDMAEWCSAQKTFPRNVMTALNRALGLRRKIR